MNPASLFKNAKPLPIQQFGHLHYLHYQILLFPGRIAVQEENIFFIPIGT